MAFEASSRVHPLLYQPTIPPTPPGVTFDGQTILITGGNSGIGFEAARQCLILHARHVIITVRDKRKAQDTLSRLNNDILIRRANPNATIEAYELELDDYKSVSQFVAKVKQHLAELDILLCNAATTLFSHQISKDGHEKHMQVNCYSHFLIILELLPLLRATSVARKAPSRLTMVGSWSQSQHNISIPQLASETSLIEYLDDSKNFDRFAQYQNSKLSINAVIKHLATIIPADQVLMNVCCPGIVETNLSRDYPLWLSFIMFFWRMVLARTAEVGARALIYAIRVAGVETHGQFLSHNEVAVVPPLLQGKNGIDFARRVWTELCSEASRVAPDTQLPKI